MIIEKETYIIEIRWSLAMGILLLGIFLMYFALYTTVKTVNDCNAHWINEMNALGFKNPAFYGINESIFKLNNTIFNISENILFKKNLNISNSNTT
jgi:hypothetical protein